MSPPSALLIHGLLCALKSLLCLRRGEVRSEASRGVNVVLYYIVG